MDSTGLDLTRIEPLVARVLVIEDITNGGPKQGFLMRFRGRLREEDSAAAFDRLSDLLAPFGLSPLFRWDKERHAVLLVEKAPTPKESNSRINLVLFIATFASVLFTGVMYGLGDQKLPSDWLAAAWVILQAGLPFAVAMLSILGAHEFGHYLVGRAHGVHLTLPYFIPMPLSPLGTMGAFINMKEHPKNRRHLLDIGLAGPLAGVAVAIPVLLIGLALSPVSALPAHAAKEVSLSMEGNSLLYLLLKLVVHGQLLPAPASYGDVAPWLYWLRYFFSGQPFPYGGMDVQLHPVAWAGWGGLLVTSLNLIPAGQLDGGHALYVLIGRKNARRVLPFILGALLLLGFFWNGWWLWAALVFLFGRTYAEPRDEITPLDPPRKALALLGIVLFFVVFIPVPLILI